MADLPDDRKEALRALGATDEMTRVFDAFAADLVQEVNAARERRQALIAKLLPLQARVAEQESRIAELTRQNQALGQDIQRLKETSLMPLVQEAKRSGAPLVEVKVQLGKRPRVPEDGESAESTAASHAYSNFEVFLPNVDATEEEMERSIAKQLRNKRRRRVERYGPREA
ncbi:MAG: hypothetical protein MHM6MM_005369 [Cercozoa sp. M6MM]